MTVSPLLRPEQPAVFEDFYRHYFVRVLALIRKHFPACDAEEIAQETMTRCLVNFASLDPGRDPWNWVSSVARNAAIDSLRRNRKTVSTDELPETARGVEDATYDAVVVSEHRRSVRSAMRRLRPADRQLIEDHELEGLACAEMAAVRDMTPNALRQQLHRARGRLATELRRAGASLGVLPVALHHRFGRASRRASDVSFAAGPAGASALSVIAVAGVATVATVLGIAHPAPTRITQAAGRVGSDSEAVGAVNRDSATRHAPSARQVSDGARATSARPTGARPGPDTGSIPPPPAIPSVVINRNGDPINHPRDESTNDIRVPTPLGDLYVTTYDEETPGSGVICLTGLVECPQD